MAEDIGFQSFNTLKRLFTMKEHSTVTKRRLKDGDKGFQISTENLEDISLEELQGRYSGLCNATVALQSLDDLGHAENEKAWSRMIELQKRNKLVEEEIRKRSARPVWS